MKKLVSLIVAILAMVAILFGVKNMLQAKEIYRRSRNFIRTTATISI